MTQKIILRGAEAIIYLKDNFVIKKRIKKSYRVSEIDKKIIKLRTRNEAKLIKRVSKIINVPKISKSHEKSGEILMEFIQGDKLSENLNNFSLTEQKKVMKYIGKSLALIHDANVIHGDLTTSNMILKNKEIYFIDFGLGFYSTKIEDKATDLYLLKQALEAKHFENFSTLFKETLKYYKNKDKEKILKQLEKVEKRRRYKN
ncbi:MAG: KEOPS complex kinase/ATPase Bud32 [Candidatus Pacearchaeota archaeon]|nr:KEOPS complex kinase/ATPase Bud32 [Candidatus Pacearchaeota archaeon]